MPKRGHPGQYGVDLPQSAYLDPQMISKMANEIFHEVPLPPGAPEIGASSELLNPAALGGTSIVPPPPGPLQLEPLPGQIHTYRDSSTFEALDPASHLYLGETTVPDLSRMAFGVLGAIGGGSGLNRLYFLGDDRATDKSSGGYPGKASNTGEGASAFTRASPLTVSCPGPESRTPSQPDGYALPGVRSRDSAQFDVYRIRNDFPVLQQQVNGKPLVWLDNAATTQKPQCVIDALKHYYENDNSNVHRGAHTLAARATDGYEGARQRVARFIGADSAQEIVFVRGATEAINLVAFAWGPDNLKAGDEIILTELEHHSNIVPWQFLRDSLGIRNQGHADDRRRVSCAWTSCRGCSARKPAWWQSPRSPTRIGTRVPVDQIAAMAHSVGARVLVDGAQSVPHFKVDVQAMDADFFVLSGHKMFGPTGIGALYAKQEILEDMAPWQGGGSMIEQVTFERSTFTQPPTRFEAGTPNIADAIGLGAAIDYLERLPFEAAVLHEQSLMRYAEYILPTIPGLQADRQPRAPRRLDLSDDGRHRAPAAGQIPRRRGHRGASQPSLRSARAGALRPDRDGAALARLLQHA